MADEKKQVNVDFSKFPELLIDLDQMVEEDDTDRSKFIRKLVKQEKARRDALKISTPPSRITKRNNAAAIGSPVVA